MRTDKARSGSVRAEGGRKAETGSGKRRGPAKAAAKAVPPPLADPAPAVAAAPSSHPFPRPGDVVEDRSNDSSGVCVWSGTDTQDGYVVWREPDGALSGQFGGDVRVVVAAGVAAGADVDAKERERCGELCDMARQLRRIAQQLARAHAEGLIYADGRRVEIDPADFAELPEKVKGAAEQAWHLAGRLG